jgi:hypothetical protein
MDLLSSLISRLAAVLNVSSILDENLITFFGARAVTLFDGSPLNAHYGSCYGNG